MTLLLPRSRWGDVKPDLPVELIPGHDLTFGLVGAWLLNERVSQTFRDLTGNNHGTVTSMDLASVRTARGRALNFSGASGSDPRLDLGSWAPGNPMSLAGNQATFLFEVRLDLSALTGSAPRLIDKSDGPNGANGWTIYYASTEASWVLNIDGEFTSFGSEGNTGRWKRRGITKHAGGLVEYFHNGDNGLIRPRSGTDSFSSAIPTGTTVNGSIGNWSGSGDRNMAGDISWVYVWDRVLSHREQTTIGHAPFTFLQPVRPRRLYHVFGSRPTSTGSGVVVFTATT